MCHDLHISWSCKTLYMKKVNDDIYHKIEIGLMNPTVIMLSSNLDSELQSNVDF